MKKLNIKSAITYKSTQKTIKKLQSHFQEKLCNRLNLIEVISPVLCSSNSGIQDNLTGTEIPVKINIDAIPKESFEVVHSLAKWKRLTLYKYRFKPKEGIITNMKALRPSEKKLDSTHSICVDQWDWEAVIQPKQCSLLFLKRTVEKIYNAIKETERKTFEETGIIPCLPEKITFVHTEDLCHRYSKFSKYDRERKLCKKYGAVFLIGIGGKLPDGSIHDGRAPDYDDWSTPTKLGYRGLNGDILVWNPVLKDAFEISSMGIRVSPKVMAKQLKLCGCPERVFLPWHKLLLKNTLPQTIGGGIGQSRLLMFLLRKKHIGEVNASVWPSTYNKENLL